MVSSVQLAELLACTRTGAVLVAGHTELEKCPAGLEQHPAEIAEIEQHSAELELHPAELEQHPAEIAEIEQHSAEMEQHPAELELHPAEMEQHPAEMELHPAEMELHPAGLAAVAGFWSLHYTLVEEVHSALGQERHLHG